MQIGQSELLCIIDDDRICIRHVDTTLYNARSDQYVVFVIDEIQNDFFQLVRLHLSVADGDTGIWHFAFDKRLHFINILDAVVDEKNLSVTAHLEIDGFADDVRVATFYLCLNRVAVGRGSRDARQVAGSHQRELQGTGNRRGSHGERIDVGLQLSQFFFDGYAEFLLLVNNQQAEIFECDIFSDDAMGTDDNVDLSFLQVFQGFSYLFSRTCPADIFDPAGKIFQPFGECLIMLEC